MSRGQASAVNTQGTNLLNTENANSSTALNSVLPAYQAQLANPGYTPAQQNAITQNSLGGIGAAFGAANQNATNTAARTGNAADLTSQQDALARERMQAVGSQEAQNQNTFTNAARADRNAAQGGLSGIFRTSQGGANSTLGTLSGNANAGNNKSFWDQLTSGVLGAGSTALGKWLSPSSGGNNNGANG